MGENSIFWTVSPQLCQIGHAVAQCLSRLKIVHALQPINREGFQHQYILQLYPFTPHLRTTNSQAFLLFKCFFFLQSSFRSAPTESLCQCCTSCTKPDRCPTCDQYDRWLLVKRIECIIQYYMGIN